MSKKLAVMSIGRAAAEMQLPLERIKTTAAELNIQPHRINGVAHFDDADLRLIDEHARQERATV